MRHRSSLVIGALAACNQVYGLTGNLSVTDAQVFDARPAQCPPAGTLPVFDHSDLHDLITQSCVGYTRSEDDARALATCGTGIFEGDVDGPLEQALGLESVGLVSYVDPRMAPDGDLATIQRHTKTGTFTEDIDSIVIRRDAGGWVEVNRFGHNQYTFATELTRGPTRRVLVGVAPGVIHELVEDGTGGWTDVRSHSIATANQLPHLSADGLRMWQAISLDDSVSYYDRPTVDDAFVDRDTLANTAGFYSAFMTADCGRLYFSILQSVWFAPQAH